MALTNFLVCTHLSLVGSCSHYCSDAEITVTKKRKRVQQVTYDVEQPESVCIHLSLSCHCMDGTQITKKTKCSQQATNLDGSWKIKKVLEKSDLGNNCRLLVSKELAKEFVIPYLAGGAEAAKEKEGVEVRILDIDDNTLHSLSFKIWTSVQSYVFTKRWIREFVHQEELKKRR
ncbi:putative B3 domain-containing protein At1g78640 [Vicia villosa]|uniref:putative B3 domain-containing protein At1g78640 n=1 Tax=Vicia villosa TaxID=3911 RepID=UPI00273AB7FE|nr:putative B3 domain-containing protein At1g78640 [Vicia villosa]